MTSAKCSLALAAVRCAASVCLPLAGARLDILDSDLDVTARQVHEYHFMDEVRHKAWDKAMIEENLRRAKDRNLSSELQTVKKMVATYQEYIYQSSCNPAIYRALGLENCLDLRAEAIDCKKRKEALRPWSEGLAKYYKKIEF